jgi:hypothetical protein
MTNWKRKMASSLALAIGLAACGGGGGGGGLVSIPPPPTPTPTPTPAAATIGAPARAIVPNANLFPIAVAGGPTIQAHSTTVFPLLQTVVSIGGGTVAAGTATMNGGATLAFNSIGDSYQLNLGNPALGVSSAVLNARPAGIYQADLGSISVFLDIANPATSNLSWTTYGFWDIHSSATIINAPFVTGYETPAGSIPASGTATYAGSVVGEAFTPLAGQQSGVGYAALSGDATLQANFASGSITGSLTNMIVTGFEGDTTPWNSVSLLGAISGGQFSGASAATSAPGNYASLSGSATGTFAGMFFGPNAQELGAVWTLFDGTSAAVGSIGATTNASGAGCWDY